MEGLLLKPNGTRSRNRLSSVRGAQYLRRARRDGSSFENLGQLAMSSRRLYRNLARESRMDKLLRDVEAMFSAIADSIYKGQVPEWEPCWSLDG